MLHNNKKPYNISHYWVSLCKLLYDSCQGAHTSPSVAQKLLSLGAKALFYTSCLSGTSGLQVWGEESSTFLIYRPITNKSVRHWFGVKRACRYSVVWQNSLPKGECNYIVVFFQLTPGEGIIGNHPCNVVPLTFWQLSETTVLWFRHLDVKSKLNIPSVPQAQQAGS